jgi:hypothetical protein
MRKAIMGLSFVALAAFSLTCGSSEDKAVARVGGQTMTVAMLKEHYLAISEEARPALMTLEEQEQFARDVVSKEILVTEARKIGIDKLPEVSRATSNAIQRKAWEVFYQEQVKSRVEVAEEDVRGLQLGGGDLLHGSVKGARRGHRREASGHVASIGGRHGERHVSR